MGWLKGDGIIMAALFSGMLGLFEHGVYAGLCGYQIRWFSIVVPCFEWPLWGYIGMYHFQTDPALCDHPFAAWLGVLSRWQCAKKPTEYMKVMLDV